MVELGDELVAPPLEPEDPELLDGEVLLPELEPPPLDPLLPIELVPPLPLLPVVVSLLPLPLLPLVLGLVPAVLLDPMLPEPLPPDGVLLEELVEPLPPPAPAPAPASRLLQALSESAPTTTKVAAAH